MPQIDNPLDPRQSVVAAALRAQKNMFNRSNVQLGKMQFGTAQTSIWSGSSPSNEQLTASVAVPQFATRCAFIAVTSYAGECQSFNNSATVSGGLLTGGVNVSCGSFQQSQLTNMGYDYWGTNIEISGVPTSICIGLIDPLDGETLVVSGTLTSSAMGSSEWTGCTFNSSILAMFQY